MIDAVLLRAFVDELVLAGVREAIVCPGSRSTPDRHPISRSTTSCCPAGVMPEGGTSDDSNHESRRPCPHPLTLR